MSKDKLFTAKDKLFTAKDKLFTAKDKLFTAKDKLFTAKVDEDLLSSFRSACASEDTTASQAVRAFMREYVRKHGQGDLFKQVKGNKR